MMNSSVFPVLTAQTSLCPAKAGSQLPGLLGISIGTPLGLKKLLGNGSSGGPPVGPAWKSHAWKVVPGVKRGHGGGFRSSARTVTTGHSHIAPAVPAQPTRRRTRLISLSPRARDGGARRDRGRLYARCTQWIARRHCPARLFSPDP